MATRKKAAVAESVQTVPAVDEVKKIVPAKTAPIDPHEIIMVRNGFNGILVYTSSRTGEVIRWGALGEEQEMELGELRTAKNTAKGFFENNWFVFDEEYQWVIDYLGVRHCYKNSIDIDRIEEFFELPPEEIEKKIAAMPIGQKQSISYLAREMVVDGRIDSFKVVAALEKSLGIELIER